MKVFSDKNSDTINIVQSIASASSMISSLTGEAREYVVSKFPNDFFRHIYIDTSQTKTQQNYNDNYNITANKLRFPSMSISPEISLDEPIAGTEKSIHLSSPNLYLRRDMTRSYNKISIDTDDDFAIYYSSEYITTNFNFKLVTNSFIQNADMAFYVKSRFQKGFFQYLNSQPIQTEIPKSFIKAIADLKGWDLNNNDDMEKMRLYLIGTSKTKDFIQKKINQSTGKICFYINKYENLLTLVDDLDAPGSISRNAQVEDTYTVSFRLQISAWIPTAFIMSINKTTLRKLDLLTVKDLGSDSNQQNEGFYSVSIASFSSGKKNTIEYQDASGKIQTGQLVFTENYTHELNKAIPEILLPDNLNKEFNKVYNHAIYKYNIDPTSLVSLKLVGRSGELSSNLYSINYNDLSINIDEEVNSDINVSLYVNRVAYETVKKAITNNDGRIASDFMTSMNVNLGDYSAKLIINYFDGDNFNTSAIEKCLRIKTAYGIGYIVLDSDSIEDGYKVCVGYDKEQPIIKRLKLSI